MPPPQTGHAQTQLLLPEPGPLHPLLCQEMIHGSIFAPVCQENRSWVSPRGCPSAVPAPPELQLDQGKKAEKTVGRDRQHGTGKRRSPGKLKIELYNAGNVDDKRTKHNTDWLVKSKFGFFHKITVKLVVCEAHKASATPGGGDTRDAGPWSQIHNYHRVHCKAVEDLTKDLLGTLPMKKWNRQRSLLCLLSLIIHHIPWVRFLLNAHEGILQEKILRFLCCRAKLLAFKAPQRQIGPTSSCVVSRLVDELPFPNWQGRQIVCPRTNEDGLKGIQGSRRQGLSFPVPLQPVVESTSSTRLVHV